LQNDEYFLWSKITEAERTKCLGEGLVSINKCRKPSKGQKGERQNTLSQPLFLYFWGCAIDRSASSDCRSLGVSTRGAGTLYNRRAK